ncbi:hypothetical protein ACH4Q7_22695 [Streptomyces roseolus]|uniref:hypothetical protein n=1 Tax=Streptomyces roseolus TaxID=67358 RepID=UPI0037988819
MTARPAPAPAAGFPAGTMVLARHGIIPIEDIAAGDLVFTHLRRWRPVTRTATMAAATVQVGCATLASGLLATSGQAFLTRMTPTLLPGPGTRMSPSAWTEVAAMTDVHRLATPVDFGQELAMPEPPASLSGQDPAEVLGMVGQMIRLKGSKAVEVCPDLVDWITEHFGPYGAGRRFPAWALTMPEELRLALLLALVDGTGRDALAIRMASKRFMVGVRMLACSLGFAAGLSDAAKAGKPAWLSSWRREGGRRADYDGYRWHSALRVELGPQVQLFALAVSEDRSHTVDGFTVQSL